MKGYISKFMQYIRFIVIFTLQIFSICSKNIYIFILIMKVLRGHAEHKVIV